MLKFEPLQKSRLFEDIIKQIQLKIREGHLKAGDKLPSEREFAEQLNVSRTSVREAYRVLEALSFIEIRPGDGVYIKEMKFEDILSPVVIPIKVDKKLLFNLMDVREVIEVETVKRATVHASREDLMKMKKCLMSAEENIQNGGKGAQQDIDFHNLFLKATSNPLFFHIMNLLFDTLKKSREATLNIPGEPEKTHREHCQIFDAIKDQDAERAAFMMKKHLTRGKENIMRISQ